MFSTFPTELSPSPLPLALRERGGGGGGGGELAGDVDENVDDSDAENSVTLSSDEHRWSPEGFR